MPLNIPWTASKIPLNDVSGSPNSILCGIAAPCNTMCRAAHICALLTPCHRRLDSRIFASNRRLSHAVKAARQTEPYNVSYEFLFHNRLLRTSVHGSDYPAHDFFVRPGDPGGMRDNRSARHTYRRSSPSVNGARRRGNCQQFGICNACPTVCTIGAINYRYPVTDHGWWQEKSWIWERPRRI